MDGQAESRPQGADLPEDDGLRIRLRQHEHIKRLVADCNSASSDDKARAFDAIRNLLAPPAPNDNTELRPAPRPADGGVAEAQIHQQAEVRNVGAIPGQMNVNTADSAQTAEAGSPTPSDSQRRSFVKRRGVLAIWMTALFGGWFLLGHGWFIFSLLAAAAIAAIAWPNGRWRLPLATATFGFALTLAGLLEEGDQRDLTIWLGLVAGLFALQLWVEDRLRAPEPGPRATTSGQSGHVLRPPMA